jgi:hypothetical protein
MLQYFSQVERKEIMITCSFCHTDSPDDSRFCKNCGQPFNQATATSSSPEFSSESLSPPLRSKAIPQSSQVYQNSVVFQKDKNRRTLLIIGSIVLVVVIIGFFIYRAATPSLPSDALTALQQYVASQYPPSNTIIVPSSWQVSSAQEISNPQTVQSNANQAWCVTISPPIEYYVDEPAVNTHLKVYHDNFLVWEVGIAWYAHEPLSGITAFRNFGCSNGDTSVGNQCATLSYADCKP